MEEAHTSSARVATTAFTIKNLLRNHAKWALSTFNQEKALEGAFSVISKSSWTFVSNSTGDRTMATQADKYLHEGGS